MKRLVQIILCAILVLRLFPAAFAEEHLEKIGDGQIVLISADNGESYYADFYLSAVDSIRRSGEELTISFGIGYITLRGFFSDGRDARILSFADGQSVSGNDFAPDGSFLGAYVSGAALEKSNQQTRIDTFQNPSAAYDYTVRVDYGGLTVIKDEMAVYGQDKQRCQEKFEQLCGDSKAYRQSGTVVQLYLKDTDGVLSAVRETVEPPDGYTITTLMPECVTIRSSSELAATGEGRTLVTFTNSPGESIARMSVRVAEDGTLSCLCPCCGEETGGRLHLLSCGHYSCQADFDPEEHRQADCLVAGHCALSEATHGKCKNCQGLLCDGKQHGVGYCKHVHSWQIVAYVPPTAEGPGSSTSRCQTCGAVYNETIG